MLSTISWSSYVTVLIIFTVIWYGFIIYKYHLKDLEDFFKGNLKSSSIKEVSKSRDGLFSEYPENFSTLEDAEELYDKLLGCIIESNDRGVSKTAFENHVRFILSEYPFVKQSALRSKINSLLISESGEYPELALTYEEMDRLWEEEE